MKAVGLAAGLGEADREVQVARRVDLDHAETRVLLVLRAQPAVERATAERLGLRLERKVPGLLKRMASTYIVASQ